MSSLAFKTNVMVNEFEVGKAGELARPNNHYLVFSRLELMGEPYQK